MRADLVDILVKAPFQVSVSLSSFIVCSRRISPPIVEALLDELCRVYGYCLPPDRKMDLLAQPPRDLDAFVDALLEAEGLEPSFVTSGHGSTWARLSKSGCLTKGEGRERGPGCPWGCRRMERRRRRNSPSSAHCDCSDPRTGSHPALLDAEVLSLR
jgi:hypothetical protein